MKGHIERKIDFTVKKASFLYDEALRKKIVLNFLKFFKISTVFVTEEGTRWSSKITR